jgi:hypothetical protein
MKVNGRVEVVEEVAVEVEVVVEVAGVGVAVRSVELTRRRDTKITSIKWNTICRIYR